ncbi:hypothetical protein ACBI99_20815 [Nonomuraea sp. ATR24]|uniref:hypothetical protein n=1 Tax=Nonomuraea sp. ATR24 TaxID=1676744 RepID=UPI0035BF179F
MTAGSHVPGPGLALEIIVRILVWLARDGERQAAMLGRGRLPVDELALEYDGALATLWVLKEARTLSPGVIGELERLDRRLEAMSGEENARLWTPAALCEAAEWATVRELAREVLADVERETGIRGEAVARESI